MQRRIRFGLCFAALTLAAPAGGQAPRLVLTQLPELRANGPEKATATVQVSPSGLIAFTTGYDADDRFFTVVDSRGRVVGRFGKKGNGPGELQPQMMQLMMTDAAAVVFSPQNLRLVLFRPSGQLIATHTMAEEKAFFPVSVVGDSVDAVTYPAANGIRRISLKTFTGRQLIPDGDSAFTPFAKGPGKGFPAFVSSATSIVAADPIAYRLQRFTTSGKPEGASFGMMLPPRTATPAELEAARLRAEANLKAGPFRFPDGTTVDLPKPSPEAAVEAEKKRIRAHISRIQLDGRDRLWVGRAIGDSVVFDVYRQRQLLGHVAVGCELKALSVAGEWVAMTCVSKSPDREVDLRLYRIVDR